MSSTPERWGEREVVRHIEFFNLDTILSVGYRVKSKRGIQFRLWAIRTLCAHQGRGLLDVIGRYTKTFLLLLRPNEVRFAVVRLKVSSGDIVSPPCQAAAVLLARSANGPTEWNDVKGSRSRSTRNDVAGGFCWGSGVRTTRADIPTALGPFCHGASHPQALGSHPPEWFLKLSRSIAPRSPIGSNHTRISWLALPMVRIYDG